MLFTPIVVFGLFRRARNDEIYWYIVLTRQRLIFEYERTQEVTSPAPSRPKRHQLYGHTAASRVVDRMIGRGCFAGCFLSRSTTKGMQLSMSISRRIRQVLAMDVSDLRALSRQSQVTLDRLVRRRPPGPPFMSGSRIPGSFVMFYKAWARTPFFVMTSAFRYGRRASGTSTLPSAR